MELKVLMRRQNLLDPFVLVVHVRYTIHHRNKYVRTCYRRNMWLNKHGDYELINTLISDFDLI